MALSVYVHIPYCLQRCRYCDFTTFEQNEILPPDRYVNQVLEEIRNRHHLWDTREIGTLYFGGGTPSLLDPELIVLLCGELANAGFKPSRSAESAFECTIEINPATITRAKIETYLKAGINRFSVGAQTFDDVLLTMCGRKHTAADTRETLRLLREYDLNYSFDLLFALPGQTTDGLRRDLDEVASFAPPHLSAYCLTVPEGHSMSAGRPPEGEQVHMFEIIEERLAQQGLLKYEISNFARPGYESRHNSSYWNDSAYWGIGLSSHSYDPRNGGYGTRFWNPKSLKTYAQQVSLPLGNWTSLAADQFEQLAEHESLTDFCHMHLRVMAGLSEAALRQKFGPSTLERVLPRLGKLTQAGLLEISPSPTLGSRWRLTQEGQLISNKVFEDLTFSADELHRPPRVDSSRDELILFRP